MADKPSVLFVCVHNAGRSQMAAALLSGLAGDRIEVRSAGTEPADQINPVAIAAMAELGIDIATATPNILTGDAVQTSDVVITMGCGDACPYFPGVSYRDLNPHPQKGITMSRMQLALNVDDLDEAITFYSKLFRTEPAKVKPGYANFAIAEPALKLVLVENPGHGGTLNHLGVEVESSEEVREEITRLASEGMLTEEEIGTTCCFATQNKVWVNGPAGERWEIYTVLADSETFGTVPELPAAEDTACCRT
jgi:protein-tyrosine-phosphatase/catechol 2,3-dioxygenase-like lactoylglutathione lyase family enzyme